MTPQQTLLGGWERFSGIWPDSGLLLRGCVYALPTWVPATAGPESSYWPTARAEDSESTGAHRGSPDTLTSATQTWPTPNVPNGGRTTNTSNYAKDGSKRQQMLEAIAPLWRTPDVPKDGGIRTHTTSRDGGHQITIAEQAEMWSTPNAHDATGHRGPGFTLQDRHYSAHDLVTETEQWQTPATDSFRSRGGNRKDEMGLDQQARFWPTCAARDYRTPNLRSYQDRSQTTKGEQLPNFVAHRFSSRPALPIHAGPAFWRNFRFFGRLCRSLKSGLRSPYNRSRSLFRKKLNPDFVDWLMGLPPGYTSAESDCRSMEIWFARCRQRLRSLCSAGD